MGGGAGVEGPGCCCFGSAMWRLLRPGVGSKPVPEMRVLGKPGPAMFTSGMALVLLCS